MNTSTKVFNNPLVSVVVITYNSAKYVLETLESAKEQTYKNVELIISDDGSSDNTTEICLKWLKTHHQRFLHTELLTVPQNTGLPANCNRGVKATHGKWLKMIAGDDILLPNCIADNVQYIQDNNNAQIVFSQVKVYQNEFKEETQMKYLPPSFPNILMKPHLTAEDQFHLLLLSDRITYSPSDFINKQTLLKVGGYDEADRLVEDYPIWLKLTRSGVRLHYFHKPTVGYRIHAGAINNTGEQVLFKPSEINSFAVRKKYAHPHLPWAKRAKENWNYRISKIFQSMGWNKNKILLRWLYNLYTVYLNPFVYLNAINKRISKK